MSCRCSHRMLYGKMWKSESGSASLRGDGCCCSCSDALLAEAFGYGIVSMGAKQILPVKKISGKGARKKIINLHNQTYAMILLQMNKTIHREETLLLVLHQSNQSYQKDFVYPLPL